MKNIIHILVLIASVVAVIYFADVAISQREKGECEYWNTHNYKLQSWQLEQCKF